MSRRKVSVDCLFCGKTFQSVLRWEGVPEKSYCSKECELDDQEYGDEEQFEKFSKGKDEWR